MGRHRNAYPPQSFLRLSAKDGDATPSRLKTRQIGQARCRFDQSLIVG